MKTNTSIVTDLLSQGVYTLLEAAEKREIIINNCSEMFDCGKSRESVEDYLFQEGLNSSHIEEVINNI